MTPQHNPGVIASVYRHKGDELDVAALDDLLGRLPRKRVGFYPTPFHKLANLSARYGVNFFMKREDLAGPGAVSGSKTRLAEFIIGQALEDGIDTIITQGAYLTNSGMQFAVACRAAGITPILYLQDESYRGIPTEYRGNLGSSAMTVKFKPRLIQAGTGDSPS